ncbi:hypothetical protein ACHAXS_003747 [Conticribra weissflogii]
MKNGNVWTYDSLEECCARFFPGWNYNKCVNPNGSGSNYFYVDWINEHCVKDCIGPAPCGGLAEAWDHLYERSTDCCAKLPGIPEEECIFS